MPSFHHTLIVLGPICDADDCKVIFTKNNVILYDQIESPILTGWQEKNGACIWRIGLTPTPEELPAIPDNSDQNNLRAYSAYILPRVEALLRYFMRRTDFQSVPRGSRPSRWDITAPGPDSPCLLPRHTSHLRMKQSKDT